MGQRGVTTILIAKQPLLVYRKAARQMMATWPKIPRGRVRRITKMLEGR